VAALKQRLQRMETQLAETTEALSDARSFFGLVKGGAKGRIVLYKSIPKSDDEKPTSKIAAGRWAKLSMGPPKKAGSAASRWFRVHVVDKKMGGVTIMWTKDRAEDGSDAFERFQSSDADEE
jgi:hypothetical protein